MKRHEQRSPDSNKDRGTFPSVEAVVSEIEHRCNSRQSDWRDLCHSFEHLTPNDREAVISKLPLSHLLIFEVYRHRYEVGGSQDYHDVCAVVSPAIQLCHSALGGGPLPKMTETAVRKAYALWALAVDHLPASMRPKDLPA